MDLEQLPTNDTALEMLSNITNGFYDNSYIGKSMFEVMGQELEDVREIYGELIKQIFLESATWSLPYHEMKYGLPISNNLTDDERRRRIKIKRDTSKPMTPLQMEQIIKELTGYDVYINDNLEKPLTFEMTLKNGDKNIDFISIKQKLLDIKQSHVSIGEIRKEVEKTEMIYAGMAHTTSQEVMNKIEYI